MRGDVETSIAFRPGPKDYRSFNLPLRRPCFPRRWAGDILGILFGEMMAFAIEEGRNWRANHGLTDTVMGFVRCFLVGILLLKDFSANA